MTTNWTDGAYSFNIDDIKQAYIAGATEETRLFSEHIFELQKDKGRLTDENRKAKEFLKQVIQGYRDGSVTASYLNPQYWELINQAKQFLGR